MRVLLGIIVLLHLVAIFTLLISDPGHFGDDEWTNHAEYHLLYGLLVAVAFNVVSIVLALGPVRRGDEWAWWTLLFAGVLIFWSVPVANVARDGDLPTPAPYLWAAYGVVDLICLVLLRTRRAAVAPA